MKKKYFCLFTMQVVLFLQKPPTETFCSWNDLVRVRLWRIPLLIFTHKIDLSVVSLIADVTASDMKV